MITPFVNSNIIIKMPLNFCSLKELITDSSKGKTNENRKQEL